MYNFFLYFYFINIFIIITYLYIHTQTYIYKIYFDYCVNLTALNLEKYVLY